MTPDPLDFQYLIHMLTQATRLAFQSLKQHYESEIIYAFALYTHGDFSYVTSTASSEEGLTKVAQKYIAEGRHNNRSLSEQRILLRWSPADSLLHEVGGEFFNDIDPLLEEANAIMDALYDEENDSWDAVEAFAQRVESSFIMALQTLDSEGLFGTGEQRKAITVNLLMGDQSDESRVQHAQQLNPPEVWQRLARELNERAGLWNK